MFLLPLTASRGCPPDAVARRDTLREDFAKLPELIERPLPEDARAPTVAELAASSGEPPADQLDLFG